MLVAVWLFSIALLVEGCLTGSWILGGLGGSAVVISTFSLIQILIEEYSNG
jgi:hypothetical protein